jgi:hypothetical protein
MTEEFRMTTVSKDWLQEFDNAMKRLFSIDHDNAGISDEQISWYADLSPREAALQYGEDYDLQRVDIDWLRPANP